MAKEESDVTADHQLSAPDPPPPPQTSVNKKDLRFWMVFVAIALTTFLAALDTSVLATALPTIAAALRSENLYVWIINAYLLASTATIPLFAQAADLYGRRALLVFAVALFVLGSGLCGGSRVENNGMAMMIAGRVLQGIGSGGLVTVGEILVCDMVTVRERGLYTGVVGSVWAVATVVAPILGGAFTQHVSWRWIFYINLPLAGVALAAIVLFVRVHRPPLGSLHDQIARIDIGGCILLVLSVTAVIIALSDAGSSSSSSWSSWRTLVPLLLGFAGMALFLVYETVSPNVSHWFQTRQPIMPIRLFRNRTSITVFLLSFIHSLILFWGCYFLPVYFQAVKQASPMRSAVMLFPIVTTSSLSGIVAGAVMSKTGNYRFWHILGFVLMTLSCGLFILLDEHTSTGRWVGFQLLFGIGCGFIFSSCLPPILASLPDTDVAAATGTWSFLRNFGTIWGTAIPAAVFNSRIDQHASTIDDPQVRALLVHGGAYEHATKTFMDQLGASDPLLKQAAIALYVDSLQLVWQVSVAFAGFGLLVAFFVPSIELRNELHTEYGLERRRSQDHNGERGTVSANNV